jgi:DNA-binding MarR family transcriptional regulator
MSESIPKHLLEKYAQLYNATNGENFTHTEAKEILNISGSYAGQILPKLVRAGWLSAKKEDSDRRRKIYRFQDPKTVIMEIGKKMKDK